MVELEYVKIFDNSIKVLLPICSKDVSVDVARLKYPSALRPQIIKCNPEGTVDFTFNQMQQDIPEEYLLVFLNMIRSNMMKQHSGVRFLTKEAEAGEQKNVVWTEYEMPAINGVSYYVMGIVKINQSIVQAVYNCDTRNKEEWKRIMLRSINSIRSVIYE